MTDEEWTAEEADRLNAARVDGTPPRGLEEATVAALRQRGLVRPPRRTLAGAAALFGIAAGLVLIVGWSVLQRPAAPAASGAARFVLLLYAGPDATASPAPNVGSPDTRRREYAQWARDVAAGGIAISGEELADEAREVSVPGAASSALAPLPRGFFIVSTPDLESAERIAATCPHLRYGGRIVVKRIVP